MSIRAIEEVEQVLAVINQIHDVRKVKTVKKRTNPFDLYDDIEFRMKYRFSKSGVIVLDELFGRSLTVDKRGGSLSSILQILTALRHWGCNQIQNDAADIHGITQQSVSTICRRVASAILEKRYDYIHMPTSPNEQLTVMQQFEEIAGFRKVVGAIDCTHIRVPKQPGPNSQFYINREGFSSLNVQVVCDAKLKIRNIVARWPSGTHDSHIFNESRLKHCFEEGQFQGRLLGDSDYASTSYLFTPLLNPTTRKEEVYNNALIRTHDTIEKCFGVWKNRFRCLLTGFRTSLENTKMYIVALAVLHNIAQELDEEPFTYDEYPLPQPLTGSKEQNKPTQATFIEENF